MSPIDFSQMTFQELRATLNEARERVHRAWLAHGPGTTREIAAKAEIDLLSFRPRSTELYELGLLELVDREPSLRSCRVHQGIYRARTLEQWEAFIITKRLPANPQFSFKV